MTVTVLTSIELMRPLTTGATGSLSSTWRFLRYCGSLENHVHFDARISAWVMPALLIMM